MRRWCRCFCSRTLPLTATGGAPSRWIGSLDDGKNIEGFLLRRPAGADVEISYRTRLEDGGWTDSAGFDELAGTRGVFQDLTGFAARLADTFQEQFDLAVIGGSRDEPDGVVAHDGEECVATSGTGKLYGMQVLLHPWA